MSDRNPSGLREVVAAAATAQVVEGKPPICGAVVVHCIHAGEPLRLVFRMPDALLLLNSLRVIEDELDLEEWSERVGCSPNATESLSSEVLEEYGEEEQVETPHLDS
jgi:hypothetical protein